MEDPRKEGLPKEAMSVPLSLIELMEDLETIFLWKED